MARLLILPTLARRDAPCPKRGRSERRGEARTLRYVEPLSDARTPLADFFSILLTNFGGCCGTAELLEQTSCRSKANGDV